MIAKIIPGNSFRHAIDYIQDVFKQDKNSTLVMHSNGLFLLDNKSIAQCFDSYVQKHDNNLKEPVIHVAISFHPRDKAMLTDGLKQRILSEYMHEMGYDKAEYVVYEHFDKEHPHFHLLLPAVDIDGNKINRSNERFRNKTICRRLTEKYGLYISEGKRNVNRDRLHEKAAAKYSIFDIVSDAKEKTEDWREFYLMLKEHGVTASFHYNNTTGKIMGIVFSDGNYTFSGKQLDRSLTLPKLVELFGDMREIVHESIHLCYDNYQHRLSELNSGNIYGRYIFTMLRLFPLWDKIFPKGLPDKFAIPYPSVRDFLSRPENRDYEDAIKESKDGKTAYVPVPIMGIMMMDPYQPQMALAGAGGGSSGGGMPWRDLDDDDEKWKYRFVVMPAIYPKYIKPRYIKPKPAQTKYKLRR